MIKCTIKMEEKYYNYAYGKVYFIILITYEYMC